MATATPAGRPAPAWSSTWRRLRGIRLEGKSAFVGAGRRLIDVYAPLAAKGLTIPAGSCATVALGGLALGGGIGLASRKLGTTADVVQSLRIVTADGRLLTCDERHNADLFWACRGGGGRNFGIVTDFRLRASPVGNAAYFFATWPWSAGPTIIPAWQRWAPNATDDLMTLCRLSTGTTGPTLQIFGQYLGPEKHLAGLLAPLTKASPPIRYSSGTSTYLDLMLRWAGCLGQSSAACHLVAEHGTLGRATFAGKSDYVKKPFSAAAVRTLQRGLETRQGAGHGSGSVIMDSYGGAIARVDPDATAFVHRKPLHSMQYLAYWGGRAAPGPVAGVAACLARVDASVRHRGRVRQLCRPRSRALAERLLRIELRAAGGGQAPVRPRPAVPLPAGDRLVVTRCRGGPAGIAGLLGLAEN